MFFFYINCLNQCKSCCWTVTFYNLYADFTDVTLYSFYAYCTVWQISVLNLACLLELMMHFLNSLHCDSSGFLSCTTYMYIVFIIISLLHFVSNCQLQYTDSRAKITLIQYRSTATDNRLILNQCKSDNLRATYCFYGINYSQFIIVFVFF